MMAANQRTTWDLALFAATAISFALAHTQAPLYFSNQHQYFLHGHARAGVGDLPGDWLANTLDPTPAFSFLVENSLRHSNEWVFHLEFFVLLVAYFTCLIGIGALLVPEGPLRGRILFLLGALLIVVHAGIVRYGSVRLVGVDYPWFFQAGVAGQYLLGPGLQPSAFGVLLLASIVVFAQGRPTWAIVLSSAACLMHPTYLLSAALLTTTYMVILGRECGWKTALAYGLLSLTLVAPVVWHSLNTFAPSTWESFAAAQQIIADFRIPHHARIARWFDLIAGLQIAWLATAIILVRRSRLFPLLAIPAVLALLLSLLQWATGDYSLALLFPWRISVVLAPVATAIILTRLAQVFPTRIDTRIVAAALIGLAVLGGIFIMANRRAYHTDERELPALEYIRDHKQAGDVYLIPVRVPSSAPGSRGVFSASFVPAPTGSQKTFISVDLQRFRLFTKAPVYVDFKSIPYKDTDVLEWRRRLDQCQKWYAAKDWSDPAQRRELRQEGITHVLMPANRPALAMGYEEMYADDSYRVYRLTD